MKNRNLTQHLAKRGWLSRPLCLILVAILLPISQGCTRAWYRRSADQEVNDILAEKDIYAEWKIEQWHVYPDPRARFANPVNPDRPPMPPDDEAAWKLSPHPQQPGLAGVAHAENTTYLEMVRAWDAQNREERTAAEALTKPQAGPPEKLPYGGDVGSREGPIQTLVDTPLGSERGLLLKLEQAVELGLINSREYQSFREDLYLVALPVTLQRFSFAWQWAATLDAVRQWAGPQSLVGQQNNWTLGSNVGVSKLFSTGALLTTSFANNTVFNFANNGFSSTSLINLDLVQPLLQGGGKAVTLEPLTQSERNLLYSIRSYARFREQFYSAISIGSPLPNNLFSAAGAAGDGTGPISALAALGISSTNVSGLFRGYMPSLYRQLDLATDVKYVRELEKALKLFEAFQQGGQISPLQVDQVRSTLLQARNTVLQDMQDWTNSLDQFKLQLGLPANLPLVLDDSMGQPITRQLDRYYQVLDQMDAAVKVIEAQEQLPPEKLRGFLLAVFTKDPLVRGTTFQNKVPASWAIWAKETDKEVQAHMEKLRALRNKLLDLKADLEIQGKTLSPEDAKALSNTDLEIDLGVLEQTLRRYEGRPWEKVKKEKEEQRFEQLKAFRVISYNAQLLLVWARNDRVAMVGQMWPTLPPVPLGDLDLLTADVAIAQETAVQAALQNRWDLMNARARVVDAWRQLAVSANGLMGVLNVQYHLDSTTPPGGSKPMSFSSAATNQELIINTQLPLVRVEERNIYRTALINYERARRNLMSLEDSIAAQVRFDVRQLQLFSENFKIQQKVLELLYSQVENSLAVIVAPVDPEQLRASATAGQANAAALTNQYLGNLGQLNTAQARMYANWLSYLATRTQLYLNMERLPLDSRGVWIDERGINPELPFPRPIGGGATFRQPAPDNQWGAAQAGPGQTVFPVVAPADLERRPAALDPTRPVRLLAPSAGPPLE